MDSPLSPKQNPALARELILDEIFDLSLYRAFHAFSRGDLRPLLGELVRIEEKHVVFWENFFDTKFERLDFGRRVKLRFLAALCRLAGPKAVHLTLEAIEVYGIRKYLNLWYMYKDTPFGRAVEEVLREEFEHEDEIVSRMAERKIHPERVRNIFLGFNDGLVEMLGAVSGFFAAFHDAASVLLAASSVAAAGALSMAAGTFVSMGSEDEVRKIEMEKEKFLGRAASSRRMEDAPLQAAFIVGASYLLGAAIPVLPVLIGAASLWASVFTAAIMIGAVSFALAFLSGMNVRKRVLTNLVILAAAAGVTYAIGSLARSLWGVGA
jgi:VIT1/CCC1 family predicted Fe2+/Mn2+ transporter